MLHQFKEFTFGEELKSGGGIWDVLLMTDKRAEYNQISFTMYCIVVHLQTGIVVCQGP